MGKSPVSRSSGWGGAPLVLGLQVSYSEQMNTNLSHIDGLVVDRARHPRTHRVRCLRTHDRGAARVGLGTSRARY
jgi:hypothetical protein